MLEKGDEPIPGYRLEVFLGRGQFGEVWRATSPGGARVALKFLNLDERQGLKEFRAIQRIKSVRYPHLASVTALWLLDEEGNALDDDIAGSYAPSPPQRDTLVPSGTVESDRKPHRMIVATLLCDKNLSDRLKECRADGLDGIPVIELIGYMEEAAKGIDFLNAPRHDLGQGLVAIQHCDIKPANIMLTGDSVMICDFGVATFLSDPRIAATGTSMAGSPAFMSPECIECKPSGASDQYSLAVTYVELRTGELPLHCGSLMEVLQAHRSGKLDLSMLPPTEQTVIRKATSVDPDDRYPSAVAMARALREAVESPEQEPPPPRPPHTFARAVAGAALLVAIVWGAVQLISWRNDDQPPPAGVGLASSETTVSFQVVPADAEVRIDAHVVEPDADGRVSLSRAIEATVDIEVRKPPEYCEAHQQIAVAALQAGSHVIRLDRNEEYLQQLAQTHAGRAFDMIDFDQPQLLLLEQAAAEYRQAMELDPSRYAVVPPFVRSLHPAEQEYNFTIRCMAMHPDQPWLVARFEGTKLALWNLSVPDAPHTVLHTHTSHVCNVVTAGSYAVSADLAGQIKLTRLDKDGRALETQEPSDASGLELAIAPDLQWLITGDYEGNVHGWKLSASGTGLSPTEMGRHAQCVRGIAITPDSHWAVTAGEDGSVSKWNLRASGSINGGTRLGSHPGDVFSLTISPSGRRVAVGGEGKSRAEFPISHFDLNENTLQTLPEGHTTPVSALAYDRFAGPTSDRAGSALLASGSEDGQIQVYDGNSPRVLYSHHTAAIKSLAFCPAPGWLVSGSEDGTLGLWDLGHAERKPLVLDGRSGRVVQVLVTPQWIIAGYCNGVILLWDVRRCILVKRAADEQGVDFPEATNDGGTIRT